VKSLEGKNQVGFLGCFLFPKRKDDCCFEKSRSTVQNGKDDILTHYRINLSPCVRGAKEAVFAAEVAVSQRSLALKQAS